MVLDCPATAQGGQNNDHSEEVGPLEGGKVQNMPVVHCCGIQHTFYGKHRFLLKVRDHSIKYQLNLEEGVDRTVGINRSL